MTESARKAAVDPDLDQDVCATCVHNTGGYCTCVMSVYRGQVVAPAHACLCHELRYERPQGGT
jgi:hypothetical protein